jgi:hypothetical protein
MDQDKNSLIGISVSVAALFLFACLSAVVSMCCALAFFGSALAPDHGVFTTAGLAFLSCGFALFSFFTFRAATALYQERSWALWIARIWGVLLIGLGAMIVYDLYHPHEPAPDEYYGILVAPVCIALGSCWMIYLALPHVRTRFHN